MLPIGALHFRGGAAAVAYFVQFYFQAAHFFPNGLAWGSVQPEGKMEPGKIPAERPLQTSRNLSEKQEFHVLNEIIFIKVWGKEQQEKIVTAK